MKEGTKSYFFGAHNFILHTVFILIAWYKEYNKLPMFWEIICIFLHDIGLIGRNYLTNPEEKLEHWRLGAIIAKKLFGEKGFLFVAGHTKSSHNGYLLSKLFIADKKSWIYAPNWWLSINRKIENFDKELSKPHNWKEFVITNSKTGFKDGIHEAYLKEIER